MPEITFPIRLSKTDINFLKNSNSNVFILVFDVCVCMSVCVCVWLRNITKKIKTKLLKMTIYLNKMFCLYISLRYYN